MNKKVAYLFSVLFFIIASSAIVPSISAQNSTPQTVTLSVESADMAGNTFAGQWVEIWKDGILVDEGFSPFSVSIDVDTPYDVFIYDDPNESKFFDHWDDANTNPTRTVVIATDSTITAFFQTDSAPTVSLLVNSADMSGESFEGMWVELWQNDVIIQEGPTPFSTQVESGVQYKVFANNFEDIIFDHWEDSSTNPQRAFAIDGDAAFTAFYQTDSTSANNAPIANDDSAATDEDIPIDVDVMANDNFSGLFFVSSVTEPSNGVAAINDDNTVTYLPNQDFFGSDSFQYTVSNPAGLVQDSATVFVTVNPVNDPPVAIDDNITTDEDTPVTFFAEQNDFDVDGDEIFVASVEQGANGSAEISESGAVMYTPNPDFNGEDSFTYVLSDINGATDTGMVSVMVNPINDAPIAADDSAQTSINQSVTIDVLANDSDADGDSLSVTSTSTPSNGTATINANNTVTYSSDQDFAGNDSFTYFISDGNGGTDSATVSVTVDRILTTISVSPDSWELDVNELTNKVYLSHGRSGTVSVIDGSTDTISTTISIDDPNTSDAVGPSSFGIGINPETNLLYVAETTYTRVPIIDGVINEVTSVIELDPFAGGIEVNPDTNKIYTHSNNVFVIDGSTNTVVKEIFGASTCGVERLAINPVTNILYQSCAERAFRDFPGSFSVIIINGTTDTVTGKIQLLNSGSGDTDIVVNSITNKLYAAESLSNIIFVIDGNTNTIVDQIHLNPIGHFDGIELAINERTNKLYAASSNGGILYEIDGQTNEIIDTITVGDRPNSVAVNQETNKVYVANFGDNTVTVLKGIE